MMTKTLRSLRPLLAVLVLAAAACSGSSSSPTTSAGAPATTTTAPAPPATATTTTAAPADGDLRSLADLGTVELVDPAPPGIRPVLAWRPVEGADRYRVVVLDADGAPYWGWLGTETTVPFGGAETDDGLLASVFEPMTWTVTAIGPDGRTLAISDAGTLPGG